MRSFVRRLSTVQRRKLSLRDRSHRVFAVEALEQRDLMTGVWRYDFGTDVSPVAAGYARVTAQTGYAAPTEYGWLAGEISQVDRGVTAGATDLTRDLNRTIDGTFAVDLPAGTYVVTATMGDAGAPSTRLGVFLEDTQLDTLSIAAGQFSSRTYRVAVADGRLDLRLRVFDGASYAAIAALEIVAVTDSGPTGVRLVASLGLRNDSSAATPSTTLAPFGHPFVEGDVPATSRLEASWAPAGGAEAQVPVQVSGDTSWPDGSLRFGRLGVDLPSVEGSGWGTLSLYAAPEPRDTELPGGRTVTDVLADLRANFPFEVRATNLTRGREAIRVDAGGAGYSAADTVTFSGGSGGSAPDAVTLSLANGAITSVGFTAPATPYSSPPTVTVNSATGSGARLTWVDPPIDGSGSWVWSSADQLSQYQTINPQSRVQVEVIETGPLFVTFQAWGPFRDAVSGAAHPHLVVRAWYRCWLTPGGSIDRVEYLHSVEQGWIEDLNGGKTKADVQVGDFEVRLGGAVVPGRSWSRLRIVHHSANSLTALDDTVTSASPHTGGSDWTSGASRLVPSFDPYYWRLTGLIPPYDLDYFDASPIQPETAPAPYAPGASTSSGLMTPYMKALNNTGERGSLGLVPDWDVKAFLTDDPGHVRSSVATALAAGTMPVMVRNPETGRIPIVVSRGKYQDPGPDRLGPNRTTTRYLNNWPGQISPDFALISSTEAARGASNSDPTGPDGGWIGTYGPSHFPSLAYYAYLRTGAPWLLETVKVHAHQMVLQGPRGSVHLPSGAVLEASWVASYEERSVAWTWKMFAQALAVLPDSAIERPYLEKLYDDNSSATVAEIAAAPASFRALGIWTFPQLRAERPGGYTTFGASPWMQDYIAMARAFEYAALGRPAGTRAWLDHYAVSLRSRAGGDPGQASPWMASPYHNIFGFGAGNADYFADWSQVPSYSSDDGVSFDATAQASGWIAGHSMDITRLLDGSPLQRGDRILFHPMISVITATQSPPAPLSPGAWYYVADIDAVNRRIRIGPNPDGSSPFTGFDAAPGRVGHAIRLDRTPSPVAGGKHFVGGNDLEGYAAYVSAALDYFAALGVFDPTEEWLVGFNARFDAMAAAFVGKPSDWAARPRYKLADSFISSTRIRRDVTGPQVVSAVAVGDASGVPQLTLKFSEPIAEGSFTLADVLVQSGPTTATAVTRLDSTQYRVSFATPAWPGSYSYVVVIGPVILDVAGNAMDQDRDGANGEAADDRYTVAFAIAPPPPPPQAAAARRYDFGTATSPLADGYTRVAQTSRYSAAAGFGWVAGVIYGGGGRDGSDPLTGDLNYTADGTFAVDLPAGTYDVEVTMGEATYWHDQMGVFLEGAQVDAVTTAAGQFAARTYRVAVQDGQLTLRLRDLGGRDPNVVINALVVRPA